MTQAFNLSQLANNLNTAGQLDATDGLTGSVPIANGGTGQTTASNAINALLPSQTGNSGRYLTTNGTASSWGTVASFNGGTEVTSATNVTLTNASTQVQSVAMTTSDKSVILPNATTLSEGGIVFQIYNQGNNSFNVTDASGNVLTTLTPYSSNLTSLFLVDNSTSNGKWAVGGEVISLSSSATQISTISAVERVTAVALTSTSGVVLYSNVNTSQVRLVGYTISGTTISYGTPVNPVFSGNSGYLIRGNQKSLCRVSDTSGAGVIFYNNTSISKVETVVFAFSLSGTTVTLGTVSRESTTDYFGQGTPQIVVLNTNKLGVTNTFSNNSNVGVADYQIWTISGTSLTKNSTFTVSPNVGFAGVPSIKSQTLLTTDKVIVFFNDQEGLNSARILTISGTTVTGGTKIQTNQTTGDFSMTPDGGTTVYYASTDAQSTLEAVTISGTTITNVTIPVYYYGSSLLRATGVTQVGSNFIAVSATTNQLNSSVEKFNFSNPNSNKASNSITIPANGLGGGIVTINSSTALYFYLSSGFVRSTFIKVL